MKFLHLGDLHLGKRLNDVSLLDDQRFALDQAISICKDVDAVLIAGDIYDKSNPSAEAMSLFDYFVNAVVKLGKKIYMISGNHDSDERISYFSGIIKTAGIYSSEKFDGKLQTIRIENADEYGDICIHLLPFIKPTDVKRFYPDVEIGKSYELAVKTVIDNSEVNTDERNIIISHQFVIGAETCESEEFSVGGQDSIGSGLFDKFDYVALGHIHKPQAMGRDTLRYSGSLLKYSFSEANHNKSFCIVDVKEKGNVSIELVPVKFKHDVREVEGLLEDVLKMKYSEDYVSVILHDENPASDVMARLLTVFPNLMKYSIVNSKTNYEQTVLGNESIEGKSPLELFNDFYRFMNNNVDPSEEIVDLFTKIVEGLKGD